MFQRDTGPMKLMKQFGFALLAVVGSIFPARAQLPAATHSFSGQFIAHVPPVTGPTLMPPDLLTNASALELKPELLAISAERIKQALWLELAAHPDWRDPIHLSLRPARSAADIVDVRVERYKNSCVYRVELPSVMPRQKFVNALVSVILLEIANRNTTDRTAEIPAWLTQGLTQRLLETRGKELMLPPPRTLAGGFLFTPTINEVRRDDPMRAVRQELKQNNPLTIQELSWPSDAQLNGLDQGRYRLTAGLFVTELQNLTGGRATLRALVGELGRCYNWQTAFHRVFAATFPRPLDLEKWWALQIAHLNGRDPDRLWTTSDSLRKLDELLKVQVGVRQAQTNLPASALVSLQRVIQEWDSLRQTPMLKTKLIELDAARLRVANDVTPLVDEYRMVITSYLNQRNAPGFAFMPGKHGPPGVRQLVREAIRSLNELDRRRGELQPAETAAVIPPKN